MAFFVIDVFLFGRAPLGRAFRCIFCLEIFRKTRMTLVSKRMPLQSLTQTYGNIEMRFSTEVQTSSRKYINYVTSIIFFRKVHKDKAQSSESFSINLSSWRRKDLITGSTLFLI